MSLVLWCIRLTWQGFNVCHGVLFLSKQMQSRSNDTLWEHDQHSRQTICWLWAVLTWILVFVSFFKTSMFSCLKVNVIRWSSDHSVTQVDFFFALAGMTWPKTSNGNNRYHNGDYHCLLRLYVYSPKKRRFMHHMTLPPQTIYHMLMMIKIKWLYIKKSNHKLQHCCR